MFISKEHYDSLVARVTELEEERKRLINSMFLQGGLRTPYDMPQTPLPKPFGRKTWEEQKRELEASERVDE